MELEQFVNDVSDLDREWWPFVFLRPRPEVRMTTLRVLALAALYGVLAGLFANVVVVATGEHPQTLNPFVFPVGTTLGFFAFYRLTFAVCWNRRAERMARGERA
jgi:hypothetical protein